MLEVKRVKAFQHEWLRVTVLLQQFGYVVDHVPYESRSLERTEHWNELWSHYLENLGIINLSIYANAQLNLFFLFVLRSIFSAENNGVGNLLTISFLTLNLLVNLLDELMNAPSWLVDDHWIWSLLEILDQESEVVHEPCLWKESRPLD